MSEDELTAIAKQIIDAAAPEEATLAALVAGLKVASQRLQAPLVPVLGSLSVRTLMAMAIRRVAERYPFPERHLRQRGRDRRRRGAGAQVGRRLRRGTKSL